MSKSYFEKLKDPRWQKRRLEILDRDKFTCCACHATELELHVHHAAYERGCDPWDAPDDALITLCQPCHKVAEHLVKTVRKHAATEHGCNLYLLISNFVEAFPDDCGELANLLANLYRCPELIPSMAKVAMAAASREYEIEILKYELQEGKKRPAVA